MLLWFSVTPIGTGSPSVSADVAHALQAVARTGIAHTTESSGTVLEGDWDACVAALRAACDAVLEHAERVSVTAKIDVRRDKPGQTAADKLASIEARLGANP